MREEDETRIKKYFKDEGWELRCGPSDNTTKKPNAGVGIAVRSRHQNSIKMILTKILTEEFREVYEAWRAAKYQIDLGWDQHITIFVIYGFTGDSGEAKLGTNSIVDAIKGRVRKRNIPADENHGRPQC